MSKCVRFEELNGKPCDELECQACCDHDDVDDMACINCGKELASDLAAKAEWAMECLSGR